MLVLNEQPVWIIIIVMPFFFKGDRGEQGVQGVAGPRVCTSPLLPSMTGIDFLHIFPSVYTCDSQLSLTSSSQTCFIMCVWLISNENHSEAVIYLFFYLQGKKGLKGEQGDKVSSSHSLLEFMCQFVIVSLIQPRYVDDVTACVKCVSPLSGRTRADRTSRTTRTYSECQQLNIHSITTIIHDDIYISLPACWNASQLPTPSLECIKVD